MTTLAGFIVGVLVSYLVGPWAVLALILFYVLFWPRGENHETEVEVPDL